MSKYGQQRPEVPQVQQALQEKKIEWTIRDTEFLMRLLMSSKIDGGDIEIAAGVIKKIKELHAKLVDFKVTI